MSAAATHYRMMKNSGAGGGLQYSRSRSCPTPASRSTGDARVHRRDVRRPACSMYGTTEIGVVLVNYPGRDATSWSSQARWASRCPALRVEVQTPTERPARRA